MTKEKILNEMCDGCEGGYEYSGDGDYDNDDYDVQPSFNALSQAVNTAVFTPAPIQDTSHQISVYIKDTEQVTAGIDSSDIVEFVLNFGVSEYSGEGSAKVFTVKKRISVSKSSLLAQGIADQNQHPVTMVESVKPKVEKKPEGKSVTQRARELAGISHSKNFI